MLKGEEFTVDVETDKQALTFLVKYAADETSKIYGPIFNRMAAEHAVRFEAEKLGEKPPENITTLDEATDYIMRNLNKYPRGYNSLMYAIGKVEAKLQGATGAAAKRTAFSAMKSIIKNSGILNDLEGKISDPFEAIYKVQELEKHTKTTVPAKYKKQGNQVIAEYPDCPFKEVCRKFNEEGVLRTVGGMECINLITLNAQAEIITQKRLDYKLEEFDKPHCKGKIYEL